MASSSSTWQWKHSVFLSFSGEDVRDSFISFLYEALSKISSDVYIDYRLNPAEEIEPALMKAIESSRIAVIVFSKSYASSTWCLDELEKIIQWNKSHGQIVIPVFYNVDSAHVHDPTAGIYAEAFARHEEHEEELDQVQRWKNAMIKAANFGGWDSKVTRPNTAIVNNIVKQVLKIMIKESPNTLDSLVGMDSRIQEIKDLLLLKSEDVRLISIWGMGGIGKTTITKALFRQINAEFDASCILENIKPGGLLSDLRKKLFSSILGEQNMVPNIEHTSLFQKRKVLIILDDLANLEQLTSLIEDNSWLGSGSRIVVTSRERELFGKEGILGDEVLIMNPYELQELNYTDSIKLFHQNAFKHMKDLTTEFWSLSMSFVTYAGGIPLALVVLGRHLRGRNKKDWENSLASLKNGPNKGIQDVLRLSYDGLSEDGKKMFLDIACFLYGQNIFSVEQIFKVCKFSEDMNYLVDKCLITVNYGKIFMHRLLQEMGKKIERESNKRKRLWDYEDVNKVFNRKKVWESIIVDMSKTEELKLDAKVFERTPNLKYLKFSYSKLENNFKVQLPQGLESFPDDLIYLYWPGYPLRSFPPNFDPTKLVVLKLPHSEVCWEENKDHDTHSMVESPIPSTFKFNFLVELDFKGCKNMRNFPSTFGLKFLETLNLSGCPLMEFPDISMNIKWLYLRKTLIEEVPSSLESLNKLQKLDMGECCKLRDISLNILFGKSLGILDLEGSFLLKNLANLETMDYLSYDVDSLSSLEQLILSGTGFETLPECIKQLSRLKVLRLGGCKYLRSLPELPPSLQFLYANDCWALETISSLQEFFDLRGYMPSYQVFMFQNCLNVKEISWKNLYTSMIRRIRNIAMCKKDLPPNPQRCSFELCYPGSLLPESFAYSEDTTSVTIELLPNWNNSRFLGFVLCAVLGTRSLHQLFFNCHFQKGNGDSIDLNSWPVDCCSWYSEHVVLWYDHDLYVEIAKRKDWFSEDCNKVSFEFSHDMHQTVIKCAVYPLYEKDDTYNGFLVKKTYISWLQEITRQG